MSVDRLLKNASFAPAEVEAMGQAFAAICHLKLECRTCANS